MIRQIPLGLLLVCVTGCSSLSFSSRSLPDWSRKDSKTLSVAQSSLNSQTSLADPSNQELAIALETARLAEQRGMDRDAIDAYLQVRKLEPSTRGIAHALAVLYDRSAMTDAALREYQLALKETPGDADLNCDYGYFLYSRNEPENAEASLREALRVSPGHQQATINLALVIGSQGRYEEAHDLFTKAIGPAAAMHNIGMLRLRAGEVEAAKSMLAEAKRQDPSILVGESVLQRLASNSSPQESPAVATASGNTPIGLGLPAPSASDPIR